MSNIKQTYIIAEMSGNHNGDYQRAVDIIYAAKESGADAIKIQTYTADTITLDCDNDYFQVKGGTIWDGTTLHKLYQEAFTPWEWQPKLKVEAEKLGMDLFSSPFDGTAVDFLEEMNVSLYKVASPEVVDIPLLEKIAATSKPVIMSTGMASILEIEEAVSVLKKGGCPEITLLKCTTAYPATASSMDLLTIPDLGKRFNCHVGLSDHSLELAVPITAVALGATVIEKHFCLNRSEGGVDSAFSLEPAEFKEMVKAVRVTEEALGRVSYELTEKEKISVGYRKSLWVAQDIAEGETFTSENIRSVRPAQGLHSRHLQEVLGKKATRPLKKGTPMHWNFV